MPARNVRVALVVATALAAASIAGAAAAATSDAAARAARLYDRAERLLARNTIDTRRLAMADLEQAGLLDPSNAAYPLALGRAAYAAGFLRIARLNFERVTRLAPREPEGRFGLGQVWRRDWLKYLDERSLGKAIDELRTAVDLRPDLADAWLALVPLLVERGDSLAALQAAYGCVRADPRRPEAALALAYTAYRTGDVARADSAFRAAIPYVALSARQRFEDISPIATEADTITLHHLPARAQPEFVRRFWAELDPDLGTAVNEAQLEYWSRVAHAYFLFYDPHRREWDERGEVYVRYGAPGRARYNPLGAPLAVSFGTGPRYPANALVWDYPELGMSVLMQDRLLSEYYLLPMTRDYDPDPRPDPDSLARRTDALATHEGRGVFRTLPPGTQPIRIDGAVARFEGQDGARLLAQVEAPGGPTDSLWAEWVVLDSTRHEVTRSIRVLSPSACGATERRVGDFAADVPPGEYLVGLSVRGGGGKRGVFRATVDVPPPDAGLQLSDVVVSCGPPDQAAARGAAPAVRLEPNPSARVRGQDPLTAYFEIYHLRPGGDGTSRFEYVYTVKSAERDPRIWLQRLFQPRPVPAPLVASREESNPGALRRQFVTVPVQSLPPGRYKLEIKVRDVLAGAEATRTAEFVKPGPEPLRN